MEEQPLIPTPPVVEKRPTLMTVLCILSFIGSGLYAFSSYFVFFFYDAFLKVAPDVESIYKMPGLKDLLVSIQPGYFLSTAVINTLSLTGAILMWQMRKAGFHTYAIAQILLVIAPMYFLKTPGPDFFNILLSGTFLLLYGINFKKMR
jgi:hypothetical protein